MRSLLFVLTILTLSAAGILAFSLWPSDENGSSQPDAGRQSDRFADYWYQGLAEISSYTLDQVRYGHVRDGEAVLIFVTEPFSKEKQVKLDRPSVAGEDAVNVMKLNATRKFTTGIYPYSTMQSTFTPIRTDGPVKSLKSTTTSQEWCGQTFSQLNLRGRDYRFHGFSYFESEGDRAENIGTGMLEDELWNLIRLNPGQIPEGKVSMIPSLLYCRFRHIDTRPYEATVERNVKGPESLLRVRYPELGRELRIRYQSEFPYRVEGWEETYTAGNGQGEESLTTKAVRKKTVQLDYWRKNNPGDEAYRDQLMLNK